MVPLLKMYPDSTDTVAHFARGSCYGCFVSQYSIDDNGLRYALMLHGLRIETTDHAIRYYEADTNVLIMVVAR